MKGTMSRKNALLGIVAVLLFMLGTATVVFATPPKPAPESPTVDGTYHLQGPAVVGNLVATLDCIYPQFGDTSKCNWDVAFEITGVCKGKSGQGQVEIPVIITDSKSALELDLDLESEFLAADDSNLENIPLYGVGPAGCRSASGGEDMVIVNARKLVKKVDEVGYNHSIEAKVTVLFLIPKGQ